MMTYRDAAALACQLSINWKKTFWICHIPDFGHVIGCSYQTLISFCLIHSAAIIIGKAEGGKIHKRMMNRTNVLATFKSNSNPDVTHRVVANISGRIVCSCPGFQFHGKCWHIEKYGERRKKSCG